MPVASRCNLMRTFLIVWFSASAPVLALATIQVDLDKRSTSPENPTLNLTASEAAVVQVSSTAAVSAILGVPTYVRHDGTLVLITDPIATKVLILSFHSCREQTVRSLVPALSDAPKVKGLGYETEARTGTVPECRFAVLDRPAASWIVFSDTGAIPITLTAQPKDAPAGEPYALALQLERKPFALDWSVGFAFLNRRDRQYRVQPLANDPEHAVFIRVSDAGVPYKISAFAHYYLVRHQWLALTAGFGADVPVDSLTAMAGVTFSARTLPLANSAHLTIGLAYSQRKELRPEFERGGVVPSTITQEALLEKKPVLGGFVSMSFSFWGGEDKFKAVYSGKPKPT